MDSRSRRYSKPGGRRKNNDRIQALFDDAKAANKAIKEARKKAEDIATIVRSSSNVATALTQLLENVAKA